MMSNKYENEFTGNKNQNYTLEKTGKGDEGMKTGRGCFDEEGETQGFGERRIREPSNGSIQSSLTYVVCVLGGRDLETMCIL